jgi:uncharacterized protein YpmS
MQAFIISLCVNILLMAAFLTQYGPRIISYIRNKKNQREKQRVTRNTEQIKEIVREYLKELQND